MLFVGGIVLLLAIIGGVIGFIVYKRRFAQNNLEPDTDPDLLVASYGPTFSDTRSNTPEPNLDMTTTLSNTSAPVEETPALPQVMPVLQEGIAPSLSQAPSGDNSTNLQPNTQPPADTVATAPPPQNQIAPDELLSAEMSIVESAENELYESNGPSAVYDETTGELDIIHHHVATTQPHTQQSSPADLPLPPPIPPVITVPKT